MNKWKDPIKKPPQDDSMVLVVRSWEDYVTRDYAYYEYGKFMFPYTMMGETPHHDEEYDNVILWQELPELPKHLKIKEL